MNNNAGLNTIGIIDIDRQLKTLLDSIIGGRLNGGDRFSGRLIAFNDVYLQLENRSGKPVIVKRSEISAFWGI